MVAVTLTSAKGSSCSSSMGGIPTRSANSPVGHWPRGISKEASRKQRKNWRSKSLREDFRCSGLIYFGFSLATRSVVAASYKLAIITSIYCGAAGWGNRQVDAWNQWIRISSKHRFFLNAKLLNPVGGFLFVAMKIPCLVQSCPFQPGFLVWGCH